MKVKCFSQVDQVGWVSQTYTNPQDFTLLSIVHSAFVRSVIKLFEMTSAYEVNFLAPSGALIAILTYY